MAAATTVKEELNCVHELDSPAGGRDVKQGSSGWLYVDLLPEGLGLLSTSLLSLVILPSVWYGRVEARLEEWMGMVGWFPASRYGGNPYLCVTAMPLSQGDCGR